MVESCSSLAHFIFHIILKRFFFIRSRSLLNNIIQPTRTSSQQYFCWLLLFTTHNFRLEIFFETPTQIPTSIPEKISLFVLWDLNNMLKLKLYSCILMRWFRWSFSKSFERVMLFHKMNCEHTKNCNVNLLILRSFSCFVNSRICCALAGEH